MQKLGSKQLWAACCSSLHATEPPCRVTLHPSQPRWLAGLHTTCLVGSSSISMCCSSPGWGAGCLSHTWGQARSWEQGVCTQWVNASCNKGHMQRCELQHKVVASLCRYYMCHCKSMSLLICKWPWSSNECRRIHFQEKHWRSQLVLVSSLHKSNKE